MMATLKDARDLCGPIAMSSGACASVPLLDRRINEALRRISRSYDFPEMTTILHILAQGNIVTMPETVKSARLMNVGLTPARLRNVGYEFSTSGPGEEPECSCGSLSLIAEPGLFPTYFDIPKGREMSVAAFVGANVVGSLGFRLFGRRSNGEVLHDGTQDGEAMIANVWRNGIEGDIDARSMKLSTPVCNVEGLVLPTRAGYLTLLAYDPETYETFFLGKYHPEVTRPGFRRYRIRGAAFTEEHVVSCLVKLHAAEMKYPDDILPVQNLDALKQMVMGIREENARNFQEAQGFFQMTEQILLAELDDNQRGEEIMLPLSDNYGYGGDALSI
jgi:hypothetical protein